jgi:transketolase
MEDLQRLQKRLRRDILQASFDAHACHLGSALSALPILVDLFYVKQIKPEQFVFAKASGAGAFYAVLTDLGYFLKDKLSTYLHDFPLASKEVPGVVHSVGSIGHGLSVAAGMAWADRETDYYVLISDGELQEGSTWEALWWATKHELSNLHVIVDFNEYQACDKVDDVMNVERVMNGLSGLVSWGVYIPEIVVTNVVKGFGVSFMEGKPEWHYLNLTPELLAQALKENE